MKTCETCKWWKRGSEKTGVCRKHPPTAVPENGDRGHWPITAEWQWCGEHEPYFHRKEEDA